MSHHSEMANKDLQTAIDEIMLWQEHYKLRRGTK